MRMTPSTRLKQLLKLLAGALICRIVIDVFLKYFEYMPPDFESEFLRGRGRYFWHGYFAPFYIHILSSPWSLVLGLVLISDRFRTRFPKWHRILGRVQVLCVTTLVLPSGLWMAFYAEAGPVATVSFVLLSALTGVCIVMGWLAAVNHRFAAHRVWMQRTFLLLCSAVVIRVTGGVGTLLRGEFEYFNLVSAWTSWVLPLLVFEVYLFKSNRFRFSCPRSAPIR